MEIGGRPPAETAGAGTAHPRAGAVTEIADAGGHGAERPSWDCRSCGKPWPCDPAREHLAGEMDRVQLAILMWANMDEAIPDLPAHPPSELFDRFIGWTH